MPVRPDCQATATRPATEADDRSALRPSRRFFKPAPGTAAPGLTSLVGAVVAVGVMAGFLELAAFSFQLHVLHRVGKSTLQISRHASWMIPAAGACVAIGGMLALTLPAALAARRLGRGRWSWDWCGWALGTFLVLGPILAVRGLHGGAALFLAAATGYRLRRAVMCPTPRWRTAARWCGAIAFVFLPAYSWATWNVVAHAEGRAWASATPAPRTPNLIWIVLDTLGAEHMSLYGYSRPTTPALEAWSRSGITFDGARSPAPWTMPSHLTMFTGLWPYQHGGRVDRPYTGASPTVAEYLAERGYATAGFSANNGMCNACYGVGRGFDYYLDHPCNHEVSPAAAMRNSAIGAQAIRLAGKVGLRVPNRFPFSRTLTAPEIAKLGRDWLDRARTRNAVDARPTFLFLNFLDAHSPYVPLPGKPRQFWTGPDLTVREAQPHAGWYIINLRNAAPPADRPRLDAELNAVSNRLIAIYDDCIAGLDAEIGRFLDGLRDSGQLEDTWVIVTADHGELFGEHNLFGHGSGLHDGLTHVPLILIPPGRIADAPRGRRVAAPVSLRDLPATVTELLTPEAESPFPGRSLKRHWAGAAEVAPDPILTQMEEQHLEGADVQTDKVKTMDAVYDEGHVLISGSSIFSNGPADELYDLAADPKQLNNLAADPSKRELLERLRKTMDTLRPKR